MPNKYYNNMHGENFPKKEGAPTGVTGSKGSIAEKTANWPSLPGKTQTKNRGPGVKKVKQYPVSQGI